jgi:hypothetical protein
MGPKGELLPVLMSQVSDIWLGRESSSKVLKAEHPTSNAQHRTLNCGTPLAVNYILNFQVLSQSRPINDVGAASCRE